MSAGRLDDREAVVDNMVPDGGGETNGESEAGEVKTFDDILVHLGNFGRYQRRVYFFLFLPTIFSAMHKLAWVFLGAKVNHRCRLEEEVGMEDAKYTVSEVGNLETLRLTLLRSRVPHSYNIVRGYSYHSIPPWRTHPTRLLTWIL